MRYLKADGSDNQNFDGARPFTPEGTGAVPSTVPPAEAARLKGLGFLRDKTGKDTFNCRVITGNGRITAEKAEVLAEAARRFGNGRMAMTTRLTVELQGITYEMADALVAFLAANGMETGGTGAKVRPIVACKGTTCQFGLIDTYGISEEIHRLFYQGYHHVVLPHKFKIAVGGCPNNCVKPELNDLGVVGFRMPLVDAALCHGCHSCALTKACPLAVPRVENGKVYFDAKNCNNCGLCLGKCPFGAVNSFAAGYRISIGGRWGKRSAKGQFLRTVLTTKEEVLSVVEKAILLFRDQGKKGERFADTVARLGIDKVEGLLLSDELLLRKAEILAK